MKNITFLLLIISLVMYEGVSGKYGGSPYGGGRGRGEFLNCPFINLDIKRDSNIGK